MTAYRQRHRKTWRCQRSPFRHRTGHFPAQRACPVLSARPWPGPQPEAGPSLRIGPALPAAAQTRHRQSVPACPFWMQADPAGLPPPAAADLRSHAVDIVEIAEIVQIHKQNSPVLSAAAGLDQGYREALLKVLPVGQSGQGVKMGQLVQLLQLLPLLGNIRGDPVEP